MIISSPSLQLNSQAGDRLTSNQPQTDKVRIYLRRANKQAIAFHAPKIMLATDIFQVAQKYFGINQQFLLIMLRGQRIYRTLEGELTQLIFNDNDIVHIHKINQQGIKQLTINFKAYDCEDFEDEKAISIQIQPDQKIGQAVSQYFNTSKYSFVQCGRKLDLSKTFEQQCVQNQSTVIVTMFKHPVFPSVPSKVVIEKLNSKGAAEDDMNLQLQIEQFAPKTSLRKTVSWSAPESTKLQSFKKKKKPSVYKSMKIKNGKQIIWQSDSSTEQNKQNFVKKLPLKKHKEKDDHVDNNEVLEQAIKSVSSEECEIIFSDEEEMMKFQPAPTFSVQDKIYLKNELKKILFTNIFQGEPEINKLQPPQIIIDSFGQQVQQISVVPKDDEMTQTKSSSMVENNDIKGPINLRESIGKSKGSFFPIIPLNKIDDDNDQEQQQQI